MTKNEAAWLAGFLEELGDRQGSDGCNDLYLPDTRENRLLVELAHLERPVEERVLLWDDGEGPKKISTSNWEIVAHLKALVMSEHGLTKADIPDTRG